MCGLKGFLLGVHIIIAFPIFILICLQLDATLYSDIGQRFGRLDELSSKNSLEEQRKFSEEERALNYFSEGQNCKKRHGFPRACGEAVDDGDKRIANEVDNLMQYVSKAKIVPRHSSPVDTDGKIHKASV